MPMMKQMKRNKDQAQGKINPLRGQGDFTLISKAKQRWRFMSLLKSLGRLRIKLSSSTPLVSCHLYCSYRLIRSRRPSGSNRWDIHCSASLLFTLISSNLVVVDCKYVCFKPSIIGDNLEEYNLITEWLRFLINKLCFAWQIKTYRNSFSTTPSLFPPFVSITRY